MDSAEFRSWRRARYDTQEDAGDVFRVTKRTIHAWERGKSSPPGRLLELACKEIDREREEGKP